MLGRGNKCVLLVFSADSRIAFLICLNLSDAKATSIQSTIYKDAIIFENLLNLISCWYSLDSSH